MNRSTHSLTSGQVDQELRQALATGQTVEGAVSTTARTLYFDSFDWRLHRAGRLLAFGEGAWQLADLESDQPVAEQPARDGPWPRFAWDFDDEGLGPPLARLLKVRALLHLLTVRTSHRRWVVRDRQGGIVLRLAHATHSLEKPAGSPPLHLLEIDAVEGHEIHALTARQIAIRRGLPTRTLLDALLERAGLQPRSYRSKFRAEIAADRPALEAFAVISRRLLDALRQNEAGLRADVDTEFLHDFRVAIRRQRSAVAHFKTVVDKEAVAPFVRELAALGRLTGPLRDLDVHLLDRERSLSLLPAALRPGLERRFERLANARSAELTRLRHVLSSPAYSDLVQTWTELADDPPPGPLATRPVIEVARKRLRKRHARVLRDGQAIGPRSPDTALHSLRIQGKKLRYLLEFTASVFERGAVRELLSHLKQLQDNLGEYNDLSVQQEELRRALATLTSRSQASLAEAAAIGGLLAALAARQREVREEFSASFAAFADPAARDRFTTILGQRRS